MSPRSTSRGPPSLGSSPCPRPRPSTARSITGSGGASGPCSPTSSPGASVRRTAGSGTRTAWRARSWSRRWRCAGRCPPACGRPRVSPCRPKKSPGATGAGGGPRADLPPQARPAPHPAPPSAPDPAATPLGRLAELIGDKTCRQGNRVNGRSRGLPDEAFEVGGVPAGALAAVLEAHGRPRLMQQVRGHVPDHGHVGGAVAGPQPGEVLVEDDIQDPVQPVLDAPVGPYRAGEARRVEGGGGEIVAPFPLDLAAALGGALDHADHGEAGKGDLAGVAPAGEQPGHVVADGVAADLDPAVPAVGGLEGVERTRGRVG